jgi:acetyltransferase-like isoleucine patch superfamily enzyme
MIKALMRIIKDRIKSPEAYARSLGVKIGKNCLIDTRNWPSEGYLVTVGDNVQITHCVSIYCHGGGKSIRQQHPDFDIFGKVAIEDWAYIGAYSQIMPGVTIGEGALVAAGSVVTKSVAPHTVVAGNPAKYICTTEEFYERNKQYNIGTKGLNNQQKKALLLQLPDGRFIKK